MSAGPKERAGFIDAPLIGPPHSASRAIVAPIASAASCPAARVSVATATITNINSPESSTSTPNDCHALPAGTVAPKFAMGPNNMLKVRAAATAPISWLITYTATSRQGKCRVTAKAIVTAGLKCAPEMCPAAATITVIIRPKVSATPTWVNAPVVAFTMIAPQPAVTSAYVPTSSAPARRKRLGVTGLVRQLLSFGNFRQPLFQLGFDSVPRLAKSSQLVLVAADNGGGVGEAPMDALCAPGENRAHFRRLIADGNHVVKRLANILVEMFRALTADVDSALLHG